MWENIYWTCNVVNRDGLLVQLRQIIAAGGKHFLLMETKTGRWSPLRVGSTAGAGLTMFANQRTNEHIIISDGFQSSSI